MKNWRLDRWPPHYGRARAVCLAPCCVTNPPPLHALPLRALPQGVFTPTAIRAGLREAQRGPSPTASRPSRRIRL